MGKLIRTSESKTRARLSPAPMKLKRIGKSAITPTSFADYLKKSYAGRVVSVASDGTITVSPTHVRRTHRRTTDKYAPVRAAIRNLSPAERQVIEMFYFEGTPSDEIAAKVGISRMSVIRTAQQAISKIRDYLGDETIAQLRGAGSNATFTE